MIGNAKPKSYHALLLLASLASGQSSRETYPGLDDDVLQKVQDNLESSVSGSDSWVVGTQFEALLEYHYPDFAVYASEMPDLSEYSSSDISEVAALVNPVVSDIPVGQMQLMTSDSSADPCAMLPAIALMAQLDDGTGDQARAVEDQIQALLEAPRSSEGAISHRTNYTQLWSDFVYMAPPALAAYGVYFQNTSMIDLAVEQILLYRDALETDDGWQHVLEGEWQDEGIWATGNAWAAAGSLRVYATIAQSEYADDYESEMDDLREVTSTILDASWDRQDPLTGLLPNYYTGEYRESQYSMFSDTASSALMAATTYRFAQFELGDDHLDNAEIARRAIQRSIDSRGWLGNAADPIHWADIADESPEAQAFVLILQASWRDWKDALGAEVTDDSGSSSSRLRRTLFARDAFHI